MKEKQTRMKETACPDCGRLIDRLDRFKEGCTYCYDYNLL